MSDVTQIEHNFMIIREYDTLKPETLFPRIEFISAIIDSAWESYSWWVGVDFNNIPDSDEKPFIRVAGIDPDGDNDYDLVHRVLTVKDIYVAYISACAELSQDIGFVPPYSDDESSYDLDIDAEAGDVIMQFAVFGGHIYG